MKYIIIYGVDKIIKVDELPPISNYPANTIIVLDEAQVAFYLANPTASVSEVLAMELNPIPTPPEPSNEPSIEERVETNEDALDELIQYVYGGA